MAAEAGECYYRWQWEELYAVSCGFVANWWSSQSGRSVWLRRIRLDLRWDGFSGGDEGGQPYNRTTLMRLGGIRMGNTVCDYLEEVRQNSLDSMEYKLEFLMETLYFKIIVMWPLLYLKSRN